MTWFALASYQSGDTHGTGMVLENRLFDLHELIEAIGSEAPLATEWATASTDSLILQWPQTQPWLNQVADRASTLLEGSGLGAAERTMDTLRQPFRPRQIFAAASNYIEHANEMGTVLAAKANSKPYMFIKSSSSCIGPGENVVIPSQVTRPDWEVELGVVIGKRGRHVSPEDAMELVAGYTIINDVSARDHTRREDYPFKFDWFQGKSFDTFAPIGPWLVPANCIANPQALKLGLDVNGKAMQDGSAAEMIWAIKEQISYLSSLLTLQAGDLIATGTPTGVGMGRGVFLQPGDTMRAWVEKIGELVNPVVAEQ